MFVVVLFSMDLFYYSYNFNLTFALSTCHLSFQYQHLYLHIPIFPFLLGIFIIFLLCSLLRYFYVQFKCFPWFLITWEYFYMSNYIGVFKEIFIFEISFLCRFTSSVCLCIFCAYFKCIFQNFIIFCAYFRYRFCVYSLELI